MVRPIKISIINTQFVLYIERFYIFYESLSFQIDLRTEFAKTQHLAMVLPLTLICWLVFLK